MPTISLKARKDLVVRYSVPRGRVIEYEVEADRPVSTFILDEEGLAQFSNKHGGDVTSYYGGFYNRRNHRQELRLPFGGWWYLAIRNDDDKPVAVHYEVSG